MYMRGTPGVCVILPRVSARLDCDEAIISFVIRERTARPGEVRIEGRRMVVTAMKIAVLRRSLSPDFDEGVSRKGRPLSSITLPVTMMRWPQGLAFECCVVEIVFAFGDGVVSVNGTSALGKRVRKINQRPAVVIAVP